VPDEVYEQVKALFDPLEIVMLTLTAVAINGWNRLAIALRAPAGSYKAVGKRGPAQAWLFTTTRRKIATRRAAFVVIAVGRDGRIARTPRLQGASSSEHGPVGRDVAEIHRPLCIDNRRLPEQVEAREGRHCRNPQAKACAAAW
jgi:hypothetical protein